MGRQNRDARSYGNGCSEYESRSGSRSCGRCALTNSFRTLFSLGSRRCSCDCDRYSRGRQSDRDRDTDHYD